MPGPSARQALTSDLGLHIFTQCADASLAAERAPQPSLVMRSLIRLRTHLLWRRAAPLQSRWCAHRASGKGLVADGAAAAVLHEPNCSTPRLWAAGRKAGGRSIVLQASFNARRMHRLAVSAMAPAAAAAPAPTPVVQFNKLKGVLFDIDGTLTNSDPLHFKA